MKYKVFSLLIIALIFVSCDDMSRNYYMYDQEQTILCFGGGGGSLGLPSAEGARLITGNRNNGSYQYQTGGIIYAIRWSTNATSGVVTVTASAVSVTPNYTVRVMENMATHNPLNHSAAVRMSGIISRSYLIPPGATPPGRVFNFNRSFLIDSLFP